MTALAARLSSIAGSRRLALGIAVVAGLACLLLLARLAWLVLAGPTLPAQSATSVASPAMSGERRPLPEFNLFGAAAPAAGSAVDAPASRSGLMLRGTVAATDPGRGIAFISADDVDAGYRVGDALPGGGVLHEVHPDQVVIDRDGALEQLSLPRLGEGGSAQASRPPARRGGASADAGAAATGGFLTTPLRMGGPDLASARQARAPDLAALVADASIVPVLEGDQVIGVRLRLADPALLERIGLGADDVVTSVNGIPLDGPERRTELEQSLQRGGPVQLTVRRDGIDRQLTIGL